jgi:hypothetical protein
MPEWHGAKVTCHFDPSAPQCVAKVVLAEDARGHRAGSVLGDALQVNESGSYARLVMGWGRDDAEAGRRARQAAGAALRREVRAIVPRNSRTPGHAETEIREGEIQQPQSATPSPPCLPALPPPTRAITSKIARLPHAIREELNRRLRDGGAADPILEWLNSLPEVRTILANSFDGRPVNPTNLSAWRKGGHHEWNMRRSGAPAGSPDGDLAAREEEAARFMSEQIL